MLGWGGGHSDRNNAKDDLSRLREWGGGLFKHSKDMISAADVRIGYFKIARFFLIAPLWLFSHPLNHFLNSGSVHCPVDRTGVPGDDEKKQKKFYLEKSFENFPTSGGLHGVPQGERDRGPQLREGDGLSRSSQLPRDLWRRARHVRQERASERGGQCPFLMRGSSIFVRSRSHWYKYSKLITHVSRWLFQRPKEKSWVWW